VSFCVGELLVVVWTFLFCFWFLALICGWQYCRLCRVFTTLIIGLQCTYSRYLFPGCALYYVIRLGRVLQIPTFTEYWRTFIYRFLAAVIRLDMSGLWRRKRTARWRPSFYSPTRVSLVPILPAGFQIPATRSYHTPHFNNTSSPSLHGLPSLNTPSYTHPPPPAPHPPNE